MGERIAYKPPVVAGHQNDHPETLHELGRGIGPAITLRAQVTLPVGDEHMVDFTQGDIRNAVFDFEEFGQMTIGPVILLHGSRTDGYALDFFEVVEVLPEQRE